PGRPVRLARRLAQAQLVGSDRLDPAPELGAIDGHHAEHKPDRQSDQEVMERLLTRVAFLEIAGLGLGLESPVEGQPALELGQLTLDAVHPPAPSHTAPSSQPLVLDNISRLHHTIRCTLRYKIANAAWR